MMQLGVVLIAFALTCSACAESTQGEVPASSSDAPAGSEQAGSTGDPATEDSATAPDESGSSSPDLPARPLPITFTADATATVSVEIGADGGSLSTTDTNGVEYTLTIPEGALFAPQEIVVTPIALVDSPFGAAEVFAVSMEPNGLVFLEPATLEISGRTFDQSTSVAFSSDHSGDDFRAQIAIIGDTATVQVAHFSNGGFLTATEEEIDSIFDEYAPHSREGQHVQEIAIINRRVEDADARGDALADVLVSWFAAIQSDVSTASDGAAVERLLGEFVNARSYLDLLRQPDEDSTIAPSADAAMVAAAEAIQEAAVRMFDQENLRCIQDRDPDAMFGMLKWLLLYSWIGEVTQDDSGSDELTGAVKQCARFRVEFRSTAEFEFSSEVNATVPLEFQGGAEIRVDAGTMTYPAVQGTLNGTGVAGELTCTTQAPIDVALNLAFNPVFGSLSDSQFNGAAIVVRFYENTNWVCGQTPIQQALWLPWFAGAYSSSRAGDGFYQFDTERSDEAGVWAETDLISFSNGVTVTVELKLIHEPQLP